MSTESNDTRRHPDLRSSVRRLAQLCCVAFCAAIAGCTTVPPQALGVDRFDYGNELAESWKRQTLINVVRLRYSDAPVFMDVTSIISSRTRSGSVNAGGDLVESPDPSLLRLGAEGTWSSTPTVTYQPILGDKFARSLLRPIPPASVFHMLEAGWPATLVLNMTVNSMNGINNTSFIGQKFDPKFAELTDTLTRLRASGALGIRVEDHPDGDAVVLIMRGDAGEHDRTDIRRAGEILSLEPGVNELLVTFGSVQRSAREIAVTTRSMLEIILVMGYGVDVPGSHVTSGRARAVPTDVQPLVRIRSGSSAPAEAYAAVNYRGLWYWIDDTDNTSKTTFSFLMMLFSLAETGQTTNGPVVTVPSR